MKKAVFCGSFNPITIGHLDIIRRASRLCDILYVVVMNNSSKNYEISAENREMLTKMACKDFQKVVIDSFEGSLIDYCDKISCNVVIKAVRNAVDMDYELEMADMNKEFGEVETVFLVADKQYRNVSSTIVRQKLLKGESILNLVPEEIIETITSLFNK